MSWSEKVLGSLMVVFFFAADVVNLVVEGWQHHMLYVQDADNIVSWIFFSAMAGLVIWNRRHFLHMQGWPLAYFCAGLFLVGFFDGWLTEFVWLPFYVALLLSIWWDELQERHQRTTADPEQGAPYGS